MLIGPSGCGKTTLSQALNSLTLNYRKTQAVEIVQNVIDTPGEYMENRCLYRALAVTAAQADIIIIVQDFDTRQTFPPGFATMFGSKPVYGVVCKLDTAEDEIQLKRAESELRMVGATRIFFTSSVQLKGIIELRNAIESL